MSQFVTFVMTRYRYYLVDAFALLHVVSFAYYFVIFVLVYPRGERTCARARLNHRFPVIATAANICHVESCIILCAMYLDDLLRKIYARSAYPRPLVPVARASLSRFSQDVALFRNLADLSWLSRLLLVALVARAQARKFFRTCWIQRNTIVETVQQTDVFSRLTCDYSSLQVILFATKVKRGKCWAQNRPCRSFFKLCSPYIYVWKKFSFFFFQRSLYWRAKAINVL